MISRSIASHHQRAIDRLVEAYEGDDRFVALILGGSVARGHARPDSDVDFMIVATDGEFGRRNSADDLSSIPPDRFDPDAVPEPAPPEIGVFMTRGPWPDVGPVGISPLWEH